MTQFKSQIEAVNLAIRQGHIDAARVQLKSLIGKEEAKKYRLALSALCRRADVPLLGIHLLHSSVRIVGRNKRAATDRETAEYAACLAQAGVPEEAETILNDLDGARNAEVFLFRAFSKIAQWDYREAIAPLESYLASPQVQGYRRLVGKLNLGGAYAVEAQHHKAKLLLKELIEETAEFPYIKGAAFEYAAQNAIVANDFDEAGHLLDQAHRYLASANNLEALFVEKWQVILAALRSPQSAKALADLREFRKKVLGVRHWETLRQCDSFLARLTQEAKLFAHVYYGTPHEAFRRKLQAEMGKEMELPNSYVWELGGEAQTAPRLEVIAGLLNGKPVFRPGDLLHRTLVALASDFYRPIRLPNLHSRIYPGEYFNPETSPMRVHQAVSALRKWIQAHSLPLKVESREGGLSLSAVAPAGLYVTKRVEALQEKDGLVVRLQSCFGVREFNSAQAASALETSPRSVNRILVRLLSAQVLETVGTGRKIRYRLKGSP